MNFSFSKENWKFQKQKWDDFKIQLGEEKGQSPWEREKSGILTSSNYVNNINTTIKTKELRGFERRK